MPAAAELALGSEVRLLLRGGASARGFKLQGSREVEAIPALTADFVNRRSRQGLERAAKDAQRMGTGVTEEAQLLFNALDKTYNLRWEGPNIVSELGIIIKPPYTADACDGKDAAALNRFKKIVQSINQRIRNKEIR
ncbi:Protein LSM12-like [Hondaea fermentalgiana]|uniref:Protein LSM12-like n=1 Tax=Hondaea fermentalgiana TaxID=2315210 RepID=A0A2R5G306_9STRA|nr:Protein LSM12-like [Hondaea fermentalgiana]|eukprot:GBG25390.1 Protein LSM12-like [Hondaea fermentalgiana]